MTAQRPIDAVRDRLAICQGCEHYTEKRARPLLAGDGYCARLTCRLSRMGLVAYIRDVNSTCPLANWRKAFAARRATTSSPATSSPAIATVQGETMPRHSELRSDSPIEWVKQLLAQPPGPWPAHWAGFRNVEAAFVELLDEFTAGEMFAPPVDWSAEATPSRGIVIGGGGWRFFPSLYVTIRMIRRTGCALPIQVWYLGNRGEFDPRFAAALEPFGVEWIDADAEARKAGRGRRILGGWELKPFAIAYSPFREVFFLDADAYPTRNLETFFDDPRTRATGAVFWPDQKPLQAGQFSRFGIAPRNEPSFESGQLYVDKLRHWPALCTTIFLNDYSDYVYRHIYGDKDTFHLAWRKLDHEYALPSDSPGWNTIAFLQSDFDGAPLIVHRTRDKFRFGTGSVDGTPVAKHEWYMTPQWQFSTLVATHGGKIARSPHGGVENLFVDSLPMENEAHAFLAELETIVRPLGQNEPTANEPTIAAIASDFAARRRRRRTARALLLHPRSGSRLAANIVRDLAAIAGEGVRDFTLDACPCTRQAARRALDFADVAIQLDAAPEVFELLEPFGDWRAVHIVRDPRDVVVSTYLAQLDALDLADDPATRPRRLLDVIDQLAPLWQNLRRWPADDHRVLRLTLAELLADTPAAVERIAAQFGYWIKPADAAAIAKNHRLPLRPRRPSWRELFDDQVADRFDFAAGDLLARFGNQQT